MTCFTPFRQLAENHIDLNREPSRLTVKSYPVFEISKVEIKSEECAQEISSCFICFTQQMKVVINCGKSDIGHYRNVRGLGKSMVVFHLFEKLRYSNERSTTF